MALLFDINDIGLRCYYDGQLLCEAPGYALALPQQLVFGVDAEQKTRKNPLHLHNDYWHKLNTDALDNSGSNSHTNNYTNVRHNADLAYGQLSQWLQSLDKQYANEPLIFCLPSSWHNDQLSLFLGLAQHLQHPVIGLVDAAVAALAHHPHSNNQLYIEWHLHEVAISHVRQQGTTLQRFEVKTLANQGWHNLREHLLRTIAQLFVQKLRFDPRKSSDTEQLLFDQIPDWLNRACHQRTLDLTLDDLRLSIDSEDLLKPTRDFLTPLFQQLETAQHRSDIQQCIFSHRFQPIAPLLQHFERTRLIDTRALANSFQHLSQTLQQHPDGTHYVMQLESQSIQQKAEEQTDNHTLCLLTDNHAYPLNDTTYWTKHDTDHELSSINRGEHFAHFSQGGVRPGNIGQLSINAQAVTEFVALMPGDVISHNLSSCRFTVVRFHPLEVTSNSKGDTR